MKLIPRFLRVLPTAARWIRDFIEGHADYNGDGIVSPNVSDDLLELCDKIGAGKNFAITLAVT